MGSMNKKIILIQILAAGAPVTALRADNWTPWHTDKTDTVQSVIDIAAHRHMRLRGGVAPGEFYEFAVYAAEDDAPKLKNGNPQNATFSTFKADRR